MVSLKVNFTGDILKVVGPVTGIKYTYTSAKDGGVLRVHDADVEGLKKKVRKEGCRCNNQDGQSNKREYHLFE